MNLREAPQDEIESLKNEAKMSKLSSSGQEMDEKTIKSFIEVEKMNQIQGKKDGEIRVFRHGMIPKAYMWKNGKWELIGDVMGQPQGPPKSSYEGDKYFPAGEYDFIFNVNDDSGMNRRLPYNLGDNSLVAAEKFLAREGMNVGYKEQIISFISKNTKGYKIPNKTISKNNNKGNELAPLREKKFWKKMNLDGLEQKILELNEELRESGSEEALSDHDLKHLKSLLVKLRDPKIYNYIKEFSSFEDGLIKKLLKWPPNKFIPILDLMRIFVTHHASQAFFSGLDSGISIIVSIASKLKESPKVVWTLYAKFLCNMCIHDNNAVGLVKGSDIIFDTFKFIDSKNEKLMIFISDFFMTFSSRVDVTQTANDKIASKFVNCLGGFLVNNDKLNDEALMKFSVSIINFGILKSECREGSNLNSFKDITSELIRRLNLIDGNGKSDILKRLNLLI